MDQFDVLAESIGFKSQGKSAPMADLKSKTKVTSGFPPNIGINSGFDSKFNLNSAYDSNSISGSFVDDLDGVFRSNTGPKAQNSDSFDGYGDFLGVPFSNPKLSEDNNSGLGFDLNSVFKGSSNLGKKSSVTDLHDDGDYIFGEKPAQMSSGSTNLGKKSSVTSLYDDGDYMFGEMPSQISSGSINLGKKPSVTDLNDHGDGFFGGMPAQKSSSSASFDDMFGSMASPPRQSDSVDDLLGDFNGMGISSNKNSTKVEETTPESDDLIPGFGGSSPPSNGAKSATSPSQHLSGHSSQSTSNLAEDPFGVFQSSSAQMHASDPFEDFGTGQSDDLETFFRKSAQPTDASKQSSTTKDPVYDTLFPGRGPSGPKPSASKTSSRMRKVSPTPNLVDDFSALFGEAVPSEEFQEIEGESEERRKARLNHHTRTQARMANALAEKNHRDLQTQQEQEERHRLAEILDSDIKQWAAGKEGNLRALLSSLQYVLWSECGWQPVSLTDLITSVSVKKVYYKATLCVHPDKVQQKGATLQQKFIAEKVFDLLKEAWNKFNAEEM